VGSAWTAATSRNNVSCITQRMSLGIPAALDRVRGRMTGRRKSRGLKIFSPATGEEPTDSVPAPAAYCGVLVHRDTLAAAFTAPRRLTSERQSFSHSPGKGRWCGLSARLRPGRHADRRDASGRPQGRAAYTWKLVEREHPHLKSFEEQSARSGLTWGRYQRGELSPLVREIRERFNSLRDRELALTLIESFTQRSAESRREGRRLV